MPHRGLRLPRRLDRGPPQDPWTRGGPPPSTSLDNGILLCPYHHRAHDPATPPSYLLNGDSRLHRRT
ncbi:MAG TPA: HNH endonuclease [Nocardioides sp.]|uniref:HNH endonuclease n=1 Tax=Nocardioides sp. TaxID=35761 RepID=UPI002E3590AC|nr:HNH endonuclease [Nocardioides sp.]HEX3929374.1 HNH endonuclease [Nocardioides sp.]